MTVKPSPRDRLVQVAARLFQRQGFHGTGLAQILRESGSPRGSLYFYFPRGKEQLGVEAIQSASDAVSGLIRRCACSAPADDPSELVGRLAEAIARWLERSDFTAGCPVTTVTLEAAGTSGALQAACRHAYSDWHRLLHDSLVHAGRESARADALATLVLASFEGALALSRAYRSAEPLTTVGRELAALLRAESDVAARVAVADPVRPPGAAASG